MAFTRRDLEKRCRRALNRYLRTSTTKRGNLKRIQPLLSVWFKVVDRVR